MHEHDPADGSRQRLLAIAAGTLAEWGPLEVIDAAAAAGWPAAGIRVDASTWDDGQAARVAKRLEAHGMAALDVEAVFVSPAGDDGDLVVDAAAAIGARNVLVVSLGMPEDAFVERLAQLCDRAAPAGVRCVVEFTPILSIPDLATALAVVRAAERDNAGVLVDNLHLARCGCSPADLVGIDPALLPYVQLCDAPLEPPADLYADALDGRCLPGEGGLPVSEYLRFVPSSAAISAEILSGSLRARCPDAAERAAVVLRAVTAAVDDATES